MRNKSERFEIFLIDFESQIQALFDDPCEHLWKSNKTNIFVLLTFLLKSNPCWLRSEKPLHWGHTKKQNPLPEEAVYCYSAEKSSQIGLKKIF